MWCETVRKWENDFFDCHRISRTSSLAGLTPAAYQRLFTAHCSHLLRLSCRAANYGTGGRNCPDQAGIHAS
jgi:hypothetical protein